MSHLAEKYLTVLDHHIFDGVTLWGAAMTDEQRLRTVIAREAWGIWMKNPMIKPMDLCRRISTRIYAEIADKAKTDEKWKRLYDSCHLATMPRRPAYMLKLDVEALNHLVAMSTSPAPAIERAKVQHGSDWLMEHGMEHGDAKAVASGAKLKMELNNNFEDRASDADKVASMAVNITGDVTIIKPDAHNYTDEERKSLAKRYGLTDAEVTELVEQADGSYGEQKDESDESGWDPFEMTD